MDSFPRRHLKMYGINVCKQTKTEINCARGTVTADMGYQPGVVNLWLVYYQSHMTTNILLMLSIMVWFGFIVLNVTFNNISAISWGSVWLVLETGGPGENHRPVASYWHTLLSHNVVHLALIGIRTSVVIGTDCIGSSKSNYYTITAMKYNDK